MYSVEFHEDKWCNQSGEFDSLAEVFERVRIAYPQAFGRLCPDGGWLVWKDQLDSLLFDQQKIHDDACGQDECAGLAAVEISGRK